MMRQRTQEPYSCGYDEEVFRLQHAAIVQTHNVRSMHCSSISTVGIKTSNRVLNTLNESPPCVQRRRSLKAASPPHSAAPHDALVNVVKQHQRSNSADSSLDDQFFDSEQALTPRFTASSNS
jgi:hypothetical protein